MEVDSHLPVEVLDEALKSPRTVLFLHPPKSGGSTLSGEFDHAAEWSSFFLRRKLTDSDACHCGEVTCPGKGRTRKLGIATEKAEAGHGGLLIGLGHNTYGSADGITATLHRHGVRDVRCFMPVRPLGQRLTSVFRDYWTQVGRAEQMVRGELEVEEHQQRILTGYLEDSRHYRDDSGAINGRRWFTSFGKYGPGVPFFLCEIFSSTRQLRKRLKEGSLLLLPTDSIDEFVSNQIRKPQLVRRRVSQPPNAQEVSRALRDASDLIARLARRDRHYERVIRSHLNPGTF